MAIAVASITTSFDNNLVTTTAASMPATVNAGDRLVMLLAPASSSQGNTPSGWTTLYEASTSIAAYEKIADGSEGGTTAGITQASGRWAAQVYRLTGCSQLTASAVSTASTATNNAAPNSNSVTPAWGSAENLWISFTAFGHFFGTNRTISTWPTNYTSTTTADANNAGGEVAAGSGYRLLTASSEDPGAFALSGTIQGWRAITIAVPPLAIDPAGQPTSKRTGGVFYSFNNQPLRGGARW